MSDEQEVVDESVNTATVLEPGRVAVHAALERMRQKGLPGWVLTVIESYAPGFDPKGSAPYYEEAAREAGGHVHYKSIMLDGKPAYFIILAETLRITPLELQRIMAGWNAWRRNQPSAAP
jgi:hypothetical protein